MIRSSREEGKDPMTGSCNHPEPGIYSGRLMVGTLALLLLFGFSVRSLVTLFPPLAVGGDGAYYLVQVRSILRNGTLAFPDFPLLFYFQAGIAHLLTLLVEQRTAIIAAVRLTDTLLPLMLAIPVFLFARAFQHSGDRQGRAVQALVIVGLMALMSGNTLLMAGGMIKNAVALPLSFFFMFATFKWLQERQARMLVQMGIWFILASLTHMSGFIMCVVFEAITLIVSVLVRTARRRALQQAGVLLACLAGCLLTVIFFDPVRANRLLNATIRPEWLFEGSPVLLWLRGFTDEAYRGLSEPAEMGSGIALGLMGIAALWWQRSEKDTSLRIFLVTSVLTTFIFSLPLYRPDVNERLAMLAYVPGMIPAVFLLCRKTTSIALFAPLAAMMILHGVLEVKTLRQTALVPAAHQELVHLKSILPPGRIMVITRPMLRWWVAWTMEVHYSTRAAPALASRNSYDAVMVLDEIRSGAFGRVPGPSGIGGTGIGIKDGARLQTETIRTLAEGNFFRLSEVIDSCNQAKSRELIK